MPRLSALDANMICSGKPRCNAIHMHMTSVQAEWSAILTLWYKTLIPIGDQNHLSPLTDRQLTCQDDASILIIS